jgi:hypothetical protein
LLDELLLIIKNTMNTHKTLSLTLIILFKRFFKYKRGNKSAFMFFKKRYGGAVGVYMEPRGRWTEKVWEPLLYTVPYIRGQCAGHVPNLRYINDKHIRNFGDKSCLLENSKRYGGRYADPIIS